MSDPVIGRDEEIRRTLEVYVSDVRYFDRKYSWLFYSLARRTKNNPVLIGEAG